MAANMKSRKRDNNDYYTFIHDDINFYYKKAEFSAAVHTRGSPRTLFILVHVPLTLHSLSNPLTVWRVNSFPMKSPDDQQYYTVLDIKHKYIISHKNRCRTHKLYVQPKQKGKAI